MSEFDDPFRSPTAPTYREDPYPAAGSPNEGALTTVFVLSYVLGACNLLAGGLSVAGGIYGLLTGFSVPIPAGGSDPQGLSIMQWLMIAVIVLGTLFVLSAVVAVAAGYGIQIRRKWGYHLGIAVAAAAGLQTFLVLLIFWLAAPLYLFYTIFVLVVLLNPQNRAAFR